MALKSFQQALDASNGGKRHLLLGNGFSIAWNSKIFTYESLFKRADFSKMPHADQLFAAAKTQDFEVVIRELIAAAKYISVYLPKEKSVAEQMLQEAAELKIVLVKAIAENHPDLPLAVAESAYRACRVFLSHFDRKFTLNYDLLLYWGNVILDKPTRNFMSHQVGSFLGAWYGGCAFDAAGSYDLMWWVCVALGVAAAALHWPIADQLVERPAMEAVRT